MACRLPLGLGRTVFNSSFRSPILRQPVTSLRLVHTTSLPRLSDIAQCRNSTLGTFSGVLAAVPRRSFSSSTSKLVRSTYFPNSGGSGGPRPGRSFWRRMKARIDGQNDMTIIFALIGLNVGIYLLWQYAMSSWTRFRDPTLYRFMQKNFVLSEANIMAGRVWTLVTSAFSHSRGDHILINALGLYFIAPAALSLIGGASFLGLYLAGGIASSLSSLAWHRFRGDKHVGSEGASGAIYATFGFYAALFPQAQVLLFFIVPMPVWLAIGGIFSYDLYNAVLRPHSGTDSAAHIGGMAFGLLAAYRMRRGLSPFRFRR